MRVLLIATALVALGVYWLTLPTIHARRYIAALAAKDWVAANHLYADPENQFPGKRPGEGASLDAHASVTPLTLDDLLRGEREINVNINTFVDGGLVGSGLTCRVTHRGVVPGMEFP